MTNRRRAAIAVAAVAMTVLVAALILLCGDPMRRLVNAVPRDRRAIQGRLSGGFGWAPEPQVMRSAVGESAGSHIRLKSVVWSIVDAVGGDSSPHARHAAAIALVLDDHKPEGMASLSQLAGEPDADAQVWSDLAAVRCDVAISQEDASLLAEALVAADTAVRMEPGLPEALFNRALILESLGLRDQAREAWERCAKVEADPEWIGEARRRAGQLAPIEPFKDILEKNAETLARDPAAARALARSQPQDARRWGETMILGDWAEAEKRGDHAAAEKSLRIARQFGGELAATTGEGMLAGAVAAIDRADADGRQHLIGGHLLFRDGQRSSMKDRAAEAQRTLVRASGELRAGGSPLALVAEYFIAHTYHALGDLPEAREREERLLRTAPPQYPAHRAQLLWHIGLGYESDGEWGKAMDAFTESVSIFERLGEADFATSVRLLIAEVYDRIGDPQSAWMQRVLVLRQIGRSTTSRLQLALDSVSRGAIMHGQWPVAVSFLQLANEVAGRVARPLVQVEMRLLQARAFARTQEVASATPAIAQARLAAARLEDAPAREEALAEIMATEAIIAASPHEAVALLSAAIEYHGARGRRIHLPDMYLTRGRSYRAMGNDSAAAADFEAGIAEVEQHRQSLPEGEERWGIFHAAEELFEEAVSLAAARHDAATAFAYSERARARELLDRLRAVAPAATHDVIPADIAVIEYEVLPDRLVIFVATRAGVRFVEEKIDRATLERDVAAFIEALRHDTKDAAIRGRGLHARLIAPVGSWIGEVPELVIVAGPSLTAVPFAALSDGREYLVERYVIDNEPSAAVFALHAARPRPSSRPHQFLGIANPVTGDDVPRLPGAEREVARAGRAYAHAITFTGEDATPAAFLREAPRADVVHIATHGIAPAGPRGNAALLLTGAPLDISTIAATPLSGTGTVVLAACSSARGTLRAEGTISVARAFLAAGVPTVVAALWPIDDADSARFFPRLHGDLARGVPAGQALRNAQIESIRRRDSPALWAAMQSIGR